MAEYVSNKINKNSSFSYKTSKYSTLHIFFKYLLFITNRGVMIVVSSLRLVKAKEVNWARFTICAK